MIKNYIKIALRNLIQHKGFTIINLLGLSFGLVCTILISIFVYNEMTFDKFHEKSELIYRIGVNGKMGGEELNQAITAAPMYEALLNEFPDITNAVRLYRNEGRLFMYDDKKFNEPEEELLFADSSFFDIFSFRVIKGNPETALDNPFSIVLTEKYAKKYFGDEDPIGKSLRVENDTTLVEVTAIIEDCPPNSHFHFNMIGSLSTIDQSRRQNWLNHNFYTYITIVPGADTETLPEKLNGLLDKYIGPMINQVLGITMDEFFEQGNSFGYNIQNIEDIHLHSDRQYELEQNGNPGYVKIFSIIALLILLVACINFMNLATARSTRRAREVGIRKVVGSKRKQLIYQFLTESIVLSIFSLVIAVFIVLILMPYFNNLVGTSLIFNPFSNAIVIGFLLGLAIFVGLISGTYPAFVLASFRPVKVLKGKIQSGAKSGLLRSILVTGQFTVTIIILLATLIVFNQLRFMQKKDLGFEKENVLVLKRLDILGDQMEAFKHELKNHANIINVANSSHIPGTIFSNNAHFLEGKTFNDLYLLMQTNVSYEFADVLGMKMSDGRFFSRDYPTDSVGVVINEAAIKMLELEKPLEARFMFPGNEGEIQYIPVIGIVRDFHFESMHIDINPVILYFMRGNYGGYLLIKLAEGNKQETVQYVEQTWNEFFPNYPVNYVWLENEFDKIFKPEKQTSQLLIVFSLFSILISCLGLFGLISFTTNQRTSEIGIRKAMGSSVGSVVLLLFRETFILLSISTAIAIPSFFIAKNWLKDFAYKFDFGPGIFALYLIIIALFTLIIALLTVAFQSVKAASASPANSLRHE